MSTPKKDFAPNYNRELVNNILMFLATNCGNIPPDNIPKLENDLLDWNQLVEIDFVREFSEDLERKRRDPFLAKRLETIKSSGKKSLNAFFENAKKSNKEIPQLACVGLQIGNLIEDQIYLTHYDLAQVIQEQVNTFWNSGANTALIDAGMAKKDQKILPEHNPTPPECKDFDL